MQISSRPCSVPGRTFLNFFWCLWEAVPELLTGRGHLCVSSGSWDKSWELCKLMVWSAAHQLKDSPPNLRKGLWPSIPPLHLCKSLESTTGSMRAGRIQWCRWRAEGGLQGLISVQCKFSFCMDNTLRVLNMSFQCVCNSSWSSFGAVLFRRAN